MGAGDTINTETQRHGEEREDGDPFLSPARGGTHLYLIRHGDALPGADELVLDGAYDSQALSALGRRQAQALAERLRAAPVTAIYSSPLPRARQTAEPVARALGLEVRLCDDLREAHVGDTGIAAAPRAAAEGAAARMRSHLDSVAAILLDVGTWSAIPGSESGAALRARVTAAIDSIAAAHPGERVAIVTHAGVINAYLAALLGIERDFFFPCRNTSVSVVRVKGARRLLLSLNDTAHLGERAPAQGVSSR